MATLEEIIASQPDTQRKAMADRFLKFGRDPAKCSKIIFLIGPPASGKSTWTKAHLAVTDTPTVVLSTDDQVEAYAKANGLTYSQAMAKVDFQGFERNMAGSLRVAVAEHKDIIVDRTNMRTRARRRWMSEVPRHYVRVGIEFVVEPEVLYARLKRRLHETGKDVPRNIVRGMIETYQPPSYEEFDILERIVTEELV